MESVRRGLAGLLALLVLSSGLGAAEPVSSSIPSPVSTHGKLRLAPSDGVEDRYIVVLADTDSDSRGRPALSRRKLEEREDLIVDLARGHDAQVRRIWLRALPGFSARMTLAQARALAADPRVAFVEQVRLAVLSPAYTECTATTPHTASLTPVYSGVNQVIDCANPVPGQNTCRDNWGLDRIDQRGTSGGNPPLLSGTYRKPTAGVLVRLYPLDTGISSDHREFTGRIGEGINVSVGALDPSRTDVEDVYGNSHGTHVGGIMAGATYGVAKNARIHPVRVTTSGGIATDKLIDGVEWILENHPQDEPGVASLSANGPAFPQSLALALAVRRLLQGGVTLIESAGNQNGAVSTYAMTGGFFPREVILVGGSSRQDQRWARPPSDPFCVNPASSNNCASNYGPEIDVFAPAENILSASNQLDDRACFLTGTSMAAPHAAGAAANLLALHPGAEPGAVEEGLVRIASTNYLDAGTLNGSPNRLLYTVFPTSGAPVAGNDLYETAVNTQLKVPVAELLAGDFDWSGGALTFVSVSGAVSGTVSVSGGVVTFTPSSGFQGEARFVYTVRNAALQQDSATVWVQVGGLALPPVAVDDFLTTAVDTPLTFTSTQLLANDSDPDSTFVFDDFVELTAHGVLEVVTSSSWRYRPYVGFQGLDRFSYRIRAPGSPSGSVNDTLSDVADVVIQVGTQFSGDLIRDQFTNTGTGRGVGSPLNGTLTQVGSRTWSANTSAGFGSGFLTNLNGNGAIGGVTFQPSQHANATGARLEALVDSRTGGSGWTGIGFSSSATGGYWSDGQVWMYLRTGGRLHVNANGTTYSLYDSVGAAPGFVSGYNRLTLDYDWVDNSVRAWLNNTPIPLTVSDLDELGFDPDVRYVGFHGHPEGTFTPPLKIDDFHLRLYQVSERPAAPQSLQASDDIYADRVRLTWSPVAGATGYRIHRGSSSSSASQAILIPQQVTGTLFDDRTANPGTTYSYWVQAMKGAIAGPYSSVDTGKRQSGHSTTTLVTVADATVKENLPTTNFGTETFLEVRNPAGGQGRFAFIRFDIPALARPIQTVHLELRPESSAVAGVSLYKVDNMTWAENTVTWNNWGTGATAIYLYKTWELSLNGLTSSVPRLVFDVTGQVTGSGNTSVTFGLTSDFDLPSMRVDSKEEPAAPYRPRLIVRY